MGRDHALRRRYAHHHGHRLFITREQRSNHIGNAVSINISVVDIEDTVTITVQILITTGRIIFDIRDAIVVVIFITIIADAITVSVNLLGRIVWEGIVVVCDAVTVVIGIRVVANTITITVNGLGSIERERV